MRRGPGFQVCDEPLEPGNLGAGLRESRQDVAAVRADAHVERDPVEVPDELGTFTLQSGLDRWGQGRPPRRCVLWPTEPVGDVRPDVVEQALTLIACEVTSGQAGTDGCGGVPVGISRCPQDRGHQAAGLGRGHSLLIGGVCADGDDAVRSQAQPVPGGHDLRLVEQGLGRPERVRGGEQRPAREVDRVEELLGGTELGSRGREGLHSPVPGPPALHEADRVAEVGDDSFEVTTDPVHVTSSGLQCGGVPAVKQERRDGHTGSHDVRDNRSRA